MPAKIGRVCVNLDQARYFGIDGNDFHRDWHVNVFAMFLEVLQAMNLNKPQSNSPWDA